MASSVNPHLFLLPLFFLSFLSKQLPLSSAVDSISGEQSISSTQNLTSKDGNFVLGFFPLGTSPQRYYLGIWYNTDNVSVLTPVWVANRANPFTDPSSFELKLSKDGNLIIYEGQPMNSVWSTSADITSKSTEAILLDNGNLVLRDQFNSSIVFWQSFDQPSNTWLPGSKLGFNKLTGQNKSLVSWKHNQDPSPGLFKLQLGPDENSTLVIVWNDDQRFWSSGPWDGISFSNDPGMTELLSNFSYVINEQEVYFTYAIDHIGIHRFIMDVTGQIRRLAWLPDLQQWILYFSVPVSVCQVYDKCGAFGSCNENNIPFCSCIKGFSPQSPEDWNLGDQSGGCVRKSPLQCSSNNSVHVVDDVYYLMDGVKLPSNPHSVQVGSDTECESACLKNCSCAAYSYGSECSLWFGDLLNLQEQYSETKQAGKLFLRLASSELQGNKGKKTMIRTVSIVVPLGVLLLLSTIVCLIWVRKRRDKGSNKSQKDQNPLTQSTNLASELISRNASLEFSLFQFSSIVEATGNFSAANKLGQGGFGSVYKGHIPEGESIAVKRLDAHSGQGLEEFMNEIMLIAKLQHQNLVKLLGCCIEGEEKLLVYEHMQNKSLDYHLFDHVRKGQLDWSIRFFIIDGIAQGLLYIHKYSRVRIIHRDLKASNILLDSDMNPKISDFGMARIFGAKATQANTNRIVGTYGYMAPEYATEGLFSIKSDVFSFGVLLLEIISGKRNTTFHKSGKALNLLAYAWELWKKGNWLDIVDPSLRDKIITNEVSKCIIVALMCVQENAIDRPTMPEVITILNSENATLTEPKKPAFFTAGNEGDSKLQIYDLSQNDITFTDQDGR